MQKRSQGSMLLIELLIVILFFSLSATVILRLFLYAHNTTNQSGLVNEAILEAENWAERLYAADDREQMLSDMGFTEQDDAMVYETESGLFVEISMEEIITDQGLLINSEISVSKGEESLITLPLGRYYPRERG